MRDRIDDFDDATVALITFAKVDELDRYRRHLQLPFVVLSDHDREVYRSFALGKGKLHRIWGPGTVALYAKLLWRGRRIHLPNQDTSQLGGDFVIAADGTLAAAFRPDSPDTRPSIDDLLRALNA